MVKNGDFIKINYTGKQKDGTVFDTTVQSLATTLNMSNAKTLQPIIICVGEGMLIPGLDEAIVGKSGTFTVAIPAEKAFGYIDAERINVLHEQDLRKREIQARPGLHLNIDGQYGIVRSVNSGRVVVDFNHPLAGQDVVYDVEIIGNVTDLKEQVHALLHPLRIPHSVEVSDQKVLIKLPQLLPQPFMQALNDKIVKLTSAASVSFEQGTAPK